MNRLLSSRSFRISLSVLIVFSLVCTQIPLLNYLGFEFSVFMGIVGSFVAGLLTITIASRDRERQATEMLRQGAILSFLLLVPPLVIISANAILVKNCSFAMGLMFYVLIPVPSVLFSVALAALIVVLTPRWRKTLFVSSFVVILLHIAYVTFTDVQIFAFNPLVGYFPGVTYDETLNIELRLVISRIATLASAGLLALLATILHDKKTKSPQKVSFPSSWKAVVVFLSIIVVWTFVFSNQLGLSSSARFVQSQLGGIIESDHFVIIYPKEQVEQKDAERLAQVHEFYFDKLARELRVIPRRKIQSFLYASAEQKARLIGAGRTNIAKPWLWQIHMNLEDVERSLKHELVHVLAADFGFPILRIGLNSGLIEGLAVAVERVEYDESIHRLASMVYGIGMDPDIQSLFSVTGFMKAHPGVSYTLAGSFCRFLIDRYGLRRFKRLYRSADFKTYYGKELPQLVEEWQRFLNGYRFTQDHLRKATYLFKRPSIFAKECARVIASMNSSTAKMLEQKEYAAALQSTSASLQRSVSTEAIVQEGQALYRLQRYDEVLELTEGRLRDTAIAHSLFWLNLLRGDAFLALGNIADAKESYQLVLDTHVNLAFDEASALRLELINNPDHLSDVFPLLVGSGDDSTRLETLHTFSRREPENSLLRYLLGRELLGKKEYEQALEELLAGGTFTIELLEHVRQRRIARAFFQQGRYQKAKMHFWQSLNFTTNEAHAFQIQEWLERCDWFERQPGE